MEGEIASGIVDNHLLYNSTLKWVIVILKVDGFGMGADNSSKMGKYPVRRTDGVSNAYSSTANSLGERG